MEGQISFQYPLHRYIEDLGFGNRLTCFTAKSKCPGVHLCIIAGQIILEGVLCIDHGRRDGKLFSLSLSLSLFLFCG